MVTSRRGDAVHSREFGEEIEIDEHPQHGAPSATGHTAWFKEVLAILVVPVLVIGLVNFWDIAAFGFETVTAVLVRMTNRVNDLRERI